MNLPNKLTVFRLVTVPIFLVLLCVPLPIPDMWLRIITAAVFSFRTSESLMNGERRNPFVTNIIIDMLPK